MQLRKVCNHPNLFESRPTVSPFQMEGINYHTASLAWSAIDYDPFKVSLSLVKFYKSTVMIFINGVTESLSITPKKTFPVFSYCLNRYV